MRGQRHDRCLQVCLQYITSMVLGLLAPAMSSHGGSLMAQATSVPGPSLGVTGTVKRHANFPSRYVDARNIDVWLPPDYTTSDDRYPVLYVHDGQNAFDPATSFGGIDWAFDETMTRLIAAKRIKPAIVVAIWNTPKRFQEYMPRKALASDSVLFTGVPGVDPLPGPVLSDAYLRFITTEVKTFIDRTYRTRREREHTFTMGSSMGGLISLYAISELPGLFGGAACLSTHWPAGNGATVEYFRAHVPKRDDHRLYFDRGSATLDSLYAPYQTRVDAIVRAARYKEGEHVMSLVFDGAEHSERAWRARLEQPLLFLLGR